MVATIQVHVGADALCAHDRRLAGCWPVVFAVSAVIAGVDLRLQMGEQIRSTALEIAIAVGQFMGGSGVPKARFAIPVDDALRASLLAYLQVAGVPVVERRSLVASFLGELAGAVTTELAVHLISQAVALVLVGAAFALPLFIFARFGPWLGSLVLFAELASIRALVRQADRGPR